MRKLHKQKAAYLCSKHKDKRPLIERLNEKSDEQDLGIQLEISDGLIDLSIRNAIPFIMNVETDDIYELGAEILSVALAPKNDELRKDFFNHFYLKHLLLNKKVFLEETEYSPYSLISDSTLKSLLFRKHSMQELDEHFYRSLERGEYVGRIVINHYHLHKFGNGSESREDAKKVLFESIRQAGDHVPSSKTIKNYDNEYLSAAHLWAAIVHIADVKLDQPNLREIWEIPFYPDYQYYILLLSEIYRNFQTSYTIPNQGSRKTPRLSPNENLWTVPDGYIEDDLEEAANTLFFSKKNYTPTKQTLNAYKKRK